MKGLSFEGVKETPVPKDVCRLQKFQDDLAQWTDATFGENRAPSRSLHHLKEEVEELILDEYDHYEYADAFILLLDCARRAGLTAKDLLAKAYEKLEINKKRKWGPPDANGVRHHIKDANIVLHKCWLCQKEITGRVFYRDAYDKEKGYIQLPSHKKCMTVKPC